MALSTSSAETDWYLGWHLPPGWVSLPVKDEIDAATWALQDVRAAAEPHAAEERIEAAAQSLQIALEAAREGPVEGPYIAAAFAPNPIGEVLAWCNAVLLPWDQDGPLDIDTVAQLLGSDDDTVGDATRGRLDLPVGPAAWAQRMYEVDSDDGTFVMEGIGYAIVLSGATRWILVRAEWAALPLGPGLAERVRELASRIVTSPPQ